MATNRPHHHLKKRTQKAGMPAGFLHKDPLNQKKASISLIQYNKQNYKEETLSDLSLAETSSDMVTWINFDELSDVSALEEAGKKFNLHSLMLEDIASPDQRPKSDDYENHLFLTLRMLTYDQQQECIVSEQLSLVLADHYLLTFQEDKQGDLFENNRERIRKGKGRSRGLGPDYLMYSLIDTVVDHYYLILEKLGEKIENLEMQLIQKPDPDHLRILYQLKNDALYLKKIVWPLREVINKLVRDENPFIKPETRLFLKDVYDHCVHEIEIIESYRELLAGMMDLYLNSTSNRLNEVMKILTIIATIFIPLTFLSSIYGMNFEYMPELRMKYAYPVLIVVMFLIMILQPYYFKRKRWL